MSAGIDPRSEAALSMRASQLVRPPYRRRLAAAIERLLDDYEADRGWSLSAAVPFDREQVGEAHGALVALAKVLRRADSVQPRGVATVSRMLRDPASPIYSGTVRGALHLHAHAALEQLLGRAQVVRP